MRIERIQILRLRGFQEFECRFASITLIQGGNGQGKTNLLDCIKYLGARDHDPDMIYSGEKEGEMTVWFDNGYTLRVRVTQTETHRTLKDEQGRKITAIRQYLDAVMEALSYDPLGFLDLPENKQNDRLLEIMRPEAAVEDIQKAVGDVWKIDPRSIAGKNGLDAVESIEKAVYDRRTGINGDAKGKRAYAREMETKLPVQVEPPAPVEAQKLEAEKIRREISEFQTTCRRVSEDAVNELGRKANVEVEDIRKRMEAEIEIVRQRLAGEVEKVHADEREAVQQFTADRSARLQQLSGDIAAAEQYAQQHAAVEAARRIIAENLAAAEHLEAHSKQLTNALEQLEGLRMRLLEKLPIKGVTFHGGRIYGYNDEGKPVPLRMLNSEKQIRVCLSIAVAVHKEAGFVCIDGAERLEKKNRAGLLKAAAHYCEEKGMQFLLARVDDDGGPMRVTDQAGAPLAPAVA